jgi:hypothetical protein
MSHLPKRDDHEPSSGAASRPATGRTGARVGRIRLAAWLVGLACTPALCLALPRSSEVAVVGAPVSDGSEMARLVARAGGSIVRTGGRSNVLVARSGEPGFVLRLYREGAWLVLDPIVTGACLSPA